MTATSTIRSSDNENQVSNQTSDDVPIEELVAKLNVPPLPERLDEIPGIRFVQYPDESQLEAVMNLVGRDLSEPYSGTYG